MTVKKQKLGTLTDGSKVKLYTISNSNMSFSCMNYGCTLTSIILNKKNGKKQDILLGYSTLEGYINSSCCFGSFIGRFANRIGKASFSLNDKKYQLDKNDSGNTLHSGFDAYHKKVWKAKIIKQENACGVRFSRLSYDGEQGFPGNLEVSVTYLLDTNNNLTCTYNALTDAPTPVNFTNHAYFNLNGNDCSTVLNHKLTLNCSKMLETNKKLIPTGKFLEVKDTAYDFLKQKTIGKDIKETGIGYDNCYVTEAYNENLKSAHPCDLSNLVEVANVTANDVEMSVFTNMEGLQFYTANHLDGVIGKNGLQYKKHSGFCLEAQAFPDSPNKQNFPSCILEPGQKLKQITVYSFNF